jgi:hypothetical protein
VERDLRDIVLLERSPTTPDINPSRLQLVLRNGQVFAGTPREFRDDKVMWEHHLLGGRTFPLAQIAQVRRGEVDPFPVSAEESGRDVLLLSNGDRVSGIITSLDEKAVELQGADGQMLTVEWPGIAQIRLAETAEAAEPRGDWRVSLVDGSVVDVSRLMLSGDSIILAYGDVQFPMAVGAIRSIENRASRARLLLNVAPTEEEYAPYFPRAGGEGTFGVPHEVSIGNTRTRAFLPARPYSRITWNLEGQPARFKTRFALAPSGPLANCDVRIWLDDRKVLDRAGLTGDAPAEVFETPIGQARTLTLEVDFGENFDVQDQLYWIEPALIWDEKKRGA